VKTRNCWAVVILLSLLAVSCRQDSIFFTIATETAPNEKPRIEGAPTNMVVFNRKYPGRDVPIMYVASERLHWYTKAGGTILPGWDSPEYFIPQPWGKVISLAATENRLYALCRISDTQYMVQYIESNGYTWTPVFSEAATYPIIHTIYADPESQQLFAGASTRSSIYAILYLDNTTGTLKVLKENSDSSRFSALLSGAVCRKEGEDNIYYLSTNGGGIFRISENNFTDIHEPLIGTNTTNPNFMSMIKLNDTGNTIIAAERDRGALFEIKSDNIYAWMLYPSTAPIWMDKYATGALALWEDQNHAYKLLIAGIQEGLHSTTTYIYGYVEFDLHNDGSFNTGVPRRDQGNLLSVGPGGQDRYKASLGKFPINHLFQAPIKIDPEMTFFASTQTKGLWSYRNRDNNGGWQWNTEE